MFMFLFFISIFYKIPLVFSCSIICLQNKQKTSLVLFSSHLLVILLPKRPFLNIDLKNYTFVTNIILLSTEHIITIVRS